ncbi:MAG: DNA polymerase III subunit beta [Chthoniobacterales bacterium]
MKFTITQEAFSDGLQNAVSAVNPRSTLPILSNVLLQAADDHLTMTATDLDFTVRTKVAAKIGKAGSTTLPAKRLSTLVKDLPRAEIEVEVDGKSQATLHSGAGVYKIFGLPEAEFPGLPAFENSVEFKLKAADLKDGLRKTHYAISLDETRYVLNGIFFSFKADKLTLVATDGRRLALAEINDLEIPASQEREFIVRTKAIHELMRALKDDGEVIIRLSQNLVQFDCGPTTLISKLVEGNYPNYVQVIPTKVNERVTVERESLLNAVRRVSLLNNEKTASVRLSFAKGSIEITSNTPEVGEAREALAVSYKGKDISIAFNPEFLMAPLRYLQEDEVHFELIDDISPGVIKINAPFVYVLMPMRVGGV